MKNISIIFLLLISINSFSQKMEIINAAGEKIEIILFNQERTKELLEEFKGVKKEALKKDWTARTYQLSNGNFLVEFYDGQSMITKDQSDLAKLRGVRFVKNYLLSFKKNISYKIEIPYEEGKDLANSRIAKKLPAYQSDLSDMNDFAVYRLDSKQILFINLEHSKSATIYKDIKTLASENGDIEAIAYGFEDDEHYMKELAKGNALNDFEPNEHLIYPKYLNQIIKSHQLTLKESKVYIHEFCGNLYRSQKGYWVLIDDVNQPDRVGEKLPILELRIFEDLEGLKKAQANYEKYKNDELKREHFYQRISDEYGANFSNHIDTLIHKLPQILNIDEEEFSISKDGLSILNEAIKWNHYDEKLFDTWFPSVLAYYGTYYIQSHQQGKWESKFDKVNKVWIPQITLDDQTAAFDMLDFYKDLLESPVPIEWAGDFDGRRKRLRNKFKNKK